MKISDISKKLIVGAAALSSVAVVVAVFFVNNLLLLILGWLLGFAISTVKILLLEWSIDKLMAAEATRAKNIMHLSSLGRSFLTVAALFVGIYFIEISGFIGVAIGLLSMNLSVYAVNIVLKRKEKKATQAESQPESD